MLKSSNFNSIFNAVAAENAASEEQDNNNINASKPSSTSTTTTTTTTTVHTLQKHNENTGKNHGQELLYAGPTLAAQQLAAGVLQIYEPPLLKVRNELKELIGKQNKIYIDLSAEKYKLDNAEMTQLHEMMNDIKIYREKLINIKKQMQNIYQRSKLLKKRAANIQACKQKELQRKLHKQQTEEALIGKNQESQQQQLSST